MQYLTTNFPLADVGQFFLSFGPVTEDVESTGDLAFDVTDISKRSELVDIGYTRGLLQNFTFTNFIGTVDVQKSVIPRKGYQWAV